MKKSVIALGLIACAGLSGCSQRVADLTFATTKNIDLNNGEFVTGQKVKGEDKKHIVIFFPTGIPSVKESADKAIEQDRCAVGLSDVAVYSNWFYIPWVYGQQAIETSGNLVIDKKLNGCENWQPK